MNTAISVTHSDAAYYRNRQAMLIYPVIILPFLAALFWLGKGERYIDQEADAQKAGASGFNASVPTAKNGSIDGRDVETPGYGKATGGQVLSAFTNTRQDSISKGLKAIPVSNPVESKVTTHASSLATTPVTGSSITPSVRSSNAAALAATNPPRSKAEKTYYYNAPGSGSSYKGSDREIESQLRTYEASRKAPMTYSTPAPVSQPALTGNSSGAQQANIRPSDQLTASRLAEPLEGENPFLTAPTGGSRSQPTQAVLTGGNYGAKKVIAWMIPVVVHEDQAVQDGQQVKLRLIKEITADGVTVPANTILYAVCQLSNDRLRLTVNSLQLNGQLIPLDLDVYDTDGSMGVNVPGVSRQAGGQIRSSAIQGIQLPGVSGLVNNVANQARMSASNSLRQTTIRLRAGYNLFLKAQ